MTTQDTVREVVAKHLGIDADKVTLDADLRKDLGADSLDAIELVMALEERFTIEIPDSEAESMQTVSQICRYLESKGVM